MKISPELDLLIKASLGSESALAFQITSEPLDWSRVGTKARLNQVRPLVFDYLSQRHPSGASVDLLAELKEFSLGQTVTNLAFSGISIDLYQQLTRQNISTFLMKGALWAWMFYEKPGLREFGDIDFFVAKDDIYKSVDVFEQNGFEPDEYRKYLLSQKHVTADYLNTDYQLPLQPVGEHTLQSLEIQWNSSYPRYKFNFSWDELTSQAIEFKILGKTVFVPRMENQFIMMLVHHAGVEQWDKLKYIADFVRLLGLHSPDLDWHYISDVASRKGFRYLLLQSLGAAQLLTGQQYVRLVEENHENQYPSASFMEKIIGYWEDERKPLKTKSLRILKFNLKYRDSRKVKWQILVGHLKYFTHWRLIWYKWLWYKR
jgi:hypothetical protein